MKNYINDFYTYIGIQCRFSGTKSNLCSLKYLSVIRDRERQLIEKLTKSQSSCPGTGQNIVNSSFKKPRYTPLLRSSFENRFLYRYRGNLGEKVIGKKCAFIYSYRLKYFAKALQNACIRVTAYSVHI